MLDWMSKEAERMQIAPHGYHGGLLCDEMSIQEDLQCYSKLAQSKLVGFVELDKAQPLYERRHGLYNIY